MSKHAVFTFGRFNPPTESGHGKLVQAVKDHADKVGGQHYIFPSHSVDRKKNPLSHKDKVHAMKKLFPNTNIVSNEGLRHTIHVMKHLNQKHDHATMVVGSDRVGEFHDLLHKYNGKEYNFKSIHVKSAGHRDPDAEGSEGMSASKLRGLVQAGKRDEFISHYSNKKVGAHIHNKVKKAMNESKQAMFVLGGPGSGKDYVITNILSRFNLVEVQIDQILNGSVHNLIEAGCHFLINGNADSDKIQLVKSILGEDYNFAHTIVSVSNKASRERNELRMKPLQESKRIRKWLDAERLANQFENSFVFKNSLNLNEATHNELKEFTNQIENYLAFLMEENDYAWKTQVTIHKPGHKWHGKDATVFYKHDDGRVNVQLRQGFRDVHNLTLKKDEYKDFKKKEYNQTPEQKKRYAAMRKAAQDRAAKRQANEGVDESDYRWNTKVTIHSPGHKHHGRDATVFHKFDDGRMNVQVRDPNADVHNYTLQKGQYKIPRKQTMPLWGKPAGIDQLTGVKKANEVLEWGTDETVTSYKAATPGEPNPAEKVKIKKPSTVNTKPELLNLRKLKYKLKTPPSAYDSRVGGVQPTGGLNQGGSYSTIGPVGGLS